MHPARGLPKVPPEVQGRVPAEPRLDLAQKQTQQNFPPPPLPKAQIPQRCPHAPSVHDLTFEHPQPSLHDVLSNVHLQLLYSYLNG